MRKIIALKKGGAEGLYFCTGILLQTLIIMNANKSELSKEFTKKFQIFLKENTKAELLFSPYKKKTIVTLKNNDNNIMLDECIAIDSPKYYLLKSFINNIESFYLEFNKWFNENI